MRVFLLNTPEEGKLVSRDMAGGLGFDRTERMALPPLDLLGYGTVLVEHGHEVRILDPQVEPVTPAQALEEVTAFKPDAVVLTMSLPTLSTDSAFAANLRRAVAPGCRIVLKTGVRHPPALEAALRRSGVDFVLTGEGDLIIAELLSGKSREGTAWLEEGALREAPETLLADLDRLPILRRSLVPSHLYRYPRLGDGVATFQTSRGCPFSCGYYCPYPLVQGKKWRAMSAERVVRELKHLCEVDGLSKVFFRDATFTLDKQRATSICEGILELGLELTWWCETRVDCLTEPLLELMSRAGCVGINIGVETGDDVMIRERARKNVGVQQVTALSRFCKKLGLKLHFLLLIGLPGETRASLLETLRLVDQLEPESLGVTTATPYPGTPMHEDAVREGWIVEPDLETFGGHGFNMDVGVSARDLATALERIHEMGRLGSRRDPEAAERKRAIYRELSDWAPQEVV